MRQQCKARHGHFNHKISGQLESQKIWARVGYPFRIHSSSRFRVLKWSFRIRFGLLCRYCMYIVQKAVFLGDEIFFLLDVGSLQLHQYPMNLLLIVSPQTNVCSSFTGKKIDT